MNTLEQKVNDLQPVINALQNSTGDCQVYGAMGTGKTLAVVTAFKKALSIQARNLDNPFVFSGLKHNDVIHIMDVEPEHRDLLRVFLEIDNLIVRCKGCADINIKRPQVIIDTIEKLDIPNITNIKCE